MVSEYRQTTGWDWRMPTLQELEALFEARAKVPGLRMPAYYWSSTQSSDGQLMLLEMFSGHIEPSREDDSQALRPVREVTEGWQPVDGGA